MEEIRLYGFPTRTVSKSQTYCQWRTPGECLVGAQGRLARCSNGLYFFVMSDAYATRLRCIFVFSFTKKTYLHRLNDGDMT